jgi:nucleoside-diphosphate kinase
MNQQTLLIIKPDAIGRNLGGRILARIEEAGLRIVRLKMVRLSAAEARRFYHVHEGKPFLDGLVAYMSSGPAWAAVLEADEAIPRLRALAGATDPAEAPPGTIRRDFGEDKRRNSVHASDAPATAAEEMAFFGLTLAREGE